MAIVKEYAIYDRRTGEELDGPFLSRAAAMRARAKRRRGSEKVLLFSVTNTKTGESRIRI